MIKERIVFNLSDKIEIATPSQIECEIEIPFACKIIRVLATSSKWPAAAAAEFLIVDNEHQWRSLIRGGLLDLSIVSSVEGLTIPKCRLIMRGRYSGYVWPGISPRMPMIYCVTFACEEI
jgi:hypothetical protein